VASAAAAVPTKNPEWPSRLMTAPDKAASAADLPVRAVTTHIKHPHMPVGLQEDIQGAILRPALDQAQRPYLDLDPANRDRPSPAGRVHREHRLARP
jgi:hypothetical protein